MDKHTMWKRTAQGLMVVVALGLGMIFWPDSEKPSHQTEVKPSASQQGDTPSIPPQHSANGNAVQPRESASVIAKNKQFEKLRSDFLATLTLPAEMDQESAVKRCLDGLAPDMIARLLASLDQSALKSNPARQAFDHWATAKPDKAAVWAQGQADPQTRQAFMNTAALRWTATDLSGAAAWARSLPEGESRSEIMAAVGSEAVRTDPLEALLLGFELPPGPAEAELIHRAAAEWAAKDRESAVSWAENIEDKELRQRVTGHIVVASAERDPVGAASIALRQMTPGTERDRAVVSIIQRWVQIDPEDAAAWVSEFPKDQLGFDAMDNLVNLWADRDLAAAGRWLSTLPAGEMQEAGIRAYSRVLARTDAESARRLVAPTNRAQ